LLWRRRVAKLIEVSDIVHAVSKAEASRISKHYPEASRKLIVIPNSVEEDVLGYRWVGVSSNYIVYAGRIEKYKNLEKAIKVAKQLGLKLLIVGDGPYRKRLQAEANKIYPEGVMFEGFLLRDQYLEILSRARYAVNLSRREAFSIFISEALAIGVPAIVSKVIAWNLGADGKELNQDLVVVERASVITWREVLEKYLMDLYLYEA
jgi:glycosyltransferase involved in cell wall biosynthesis